VASRLRVRIVRDPDPSRPSQRYFTVTGDQDSIRVFIAELCEGSLRPDFAMRPHKPWTEVLKPRGEDLEIRDSGLWLNYRWLVHGEPSHYDFWNDSFVH